MLAVVNPFAVIVPSVSVVFSRRPLSVLFAKPVMGQFVAVHTHGFFGLYGIVRSSHLKRSQFVTVCFSLYISVKETWQSCRTAFVGAPHPYYFMIRTIPFRLPRVVS
jgi:hypothetical protein